MVFKKFTKFDFKKIHPSGSLSVKLKTVGDIMLTGEKLPVVRENINMKNLSIKKDRLNKVIATYCKHKPITENKKSEVIQGVLKQLNKK